jgi:hypothetical protein
MPLNHLVMSLLIACSIFTGQTYAAGSSVNEDFTLVKSICNDMIEVAKKGDQARFVELADSALKLSEAQRRDNSMAIDRFRPKIRAAKKAAKNGDFMNAITLLEEAKPLMKAAPTSWDGGS